MTKTVEFYFDVGSPTAYLAHKRLQQLKQQYDCIIDYHPVLLGGLFKASGNSSPVMVPAKGRYMMVDDLPRFAKLYDVPLNNNPHFPINTLNLMRGAVALLDGEYFETYIDAVFNAIWVDSKNMANIETVSEVLSSAGLNPQAILTSTQSPDVKETLITNTGKAVERGLFGAPTMFMDGEMFFGQDRLQFVEAALQQKS
ncbi:MAG: 2-hydroxychromene-2-carboxylate isomerase [Porticoccaceae bacterium]|jgi:2-hydroxychromene-2-carboxylate isomerase|nr:2-hydroxychromene-2-carboxylate isomerase [Porticoccaceae bacterium]MBT4164930.1 2-hydroxychromene-2-carboxylate isomerase [Porticoccaceae bacterium]MBT5002960.1 2-hydroxychromene-2-carboxylate isomerase [Porticoccaceae bacterium]MBT5103274.1 2-hydroxychromene-2-carboxylate isomerase [Porticoccaceae bacterium]MBT6027978.1 2-hydroxychromene-2-carboxylate isomerase [Porticoccaceae bacterium]